VLAGLRREWPIAVVTGVMVAGLVVVATGHFRRGTIVLSFAIALALFLRLLLTSSDAGLLAVRSKSIDLVVLTVLAAGTTLLALWVPPPST